MKIPRMLDWLLYALLLTVLVLLLAPQQLPVSLYKINLIALAGIVGYWLDRSLFPYARPDKFLEEVDEILVDPDIEGALMFPRDMDGHMQNDLLAAAAMLRRALIVAAAMIAVALGA
jgi:hypothetical protein